MSKLIIKGGTELKGEIPISGAKNSALIILAASLLCDSETTITNVPDIEDIHRMIEIIESLGAKVSFNSGIIKIDPTTINTTVPNAQLVNKLRGSIVLAGPLLAKFHQATFSQPGGCLIGARPIDDHLDLFLQLGIKIIQNDKFYSLKGKPKSSDITLNKISVTATENAIMASVLSKGTTKIHVAAAEPEVADLINYLNKIGAKISYVGSHDITINGVNSLSGVKYEIIPDRIEAGTYLMVAIATNSSLKIGPVITDNLNIILKKLKMAGANFEIVSRNNKEYIFTKKSNSLISQNIDTRTYPGFPTDLQAQYATLMTRAKGTSNIFETLFEGRFLYIDEIKIMGADIKILSPHIVEVNGPTQLKGKEIISRDLRGGAALIIAALVANGTTIIDNTEYIDRGYESIDQKLKNVGADIERIDN